MIIGPQKDLLIEHSRREIQTNALSWERSFASVEMPLWTEEIPSKMEWAKTRTRNTSRDV